MSRARDARIEREAAPIDLRRLVDPTLLVVAVVYGVALAASRMAGLLGIPLMILVSLSLWRYAYEVLRLVAQGRGNVPAPDFESMSPFGNFGLVLHFGFFASLTTLLADPPLPADAVAARAASTALLAIVAGAFPASASLMAVTGSLAAALDPRGIAGLAGAFGARRYALILAVGAAVLLAARLPEALGLPGFAARLLAAPLEVFSLLAVFAVTGAVLRSRRDVLEIPGEMEPEPERARRDRRGDWQLDLDRAYASIRSGLVEQGHRTIRALVERAGGSDEVYDWVLDAMLSWEDKMHGLELAEERIRRLVHDERPHPALELAASLRGADERFPVDGATAARLADYARSIGRHALADDLLEEARRRAAPGAGLKAYRGT